MIQLKQYQQNALDTLRQYLESARFKGAQTAYNEMQKARYRANPFTHFQPLPNLPDVPYVCLRLPTGGGKTLLSAHTIRLAGESYIENDYPLTLWLVPTNIIKTQALETLKDPNHANRRVLDNTFNGRYQVFDIADFRHIRPQDINAAACIVISTFAALRVHNTEGRKVYAHDENLEPHFSKIPSHLQSMETDEATGKIKFSFANLLNWHRPLVIVDEAHNAKLELSMEVLKRVNAQCVIEYTATPAKNSNTICSVTAAELKAEEMIKLPIILSEHKSWQEAITASIQMRHKLEDTAHKDKDYIRPIILFQAENKNQETTVEVLKNYLVHNENIQPTDIAIATGDQRELDSIDLFDLNCTIRYIITVQALKEGWDCSFAYVLCSVAKTRSPTAVEQLLGRVLRMPYAKKRTQETLNQAYAYVSSSSWTHATTQLHDRLINMGFEQEEAKEFISQPPLDLGKQAPFTVTLTNEPDLSHLNATQQQAVSIATDPSGTCTVAITGEIDQAFIEQLAQGVQDKKDKAEINLKGKLHIQRQAKNLSPGQRGEVFSIPQLCLRFDDGIALAETELCLDEHGWNINDYYQSLTKEYFEIDETSNQYKVDLAGDKITINLLQQSQQLDLAGVTTEMTEQDLVIWFDQKLRATDISQPQLLEYLRKTVQGLLARADLELTQLTRSKFILEKVLKERIKQARIKAYHNGFQQCMFGDNAIATIAPEEFSFTFPKDYPANDLYDGATRFNKHFHSRIGHMNGEEVECAEAIDRHPQVEFWIRNLEKQPQHAFWLPTSTDKFYPDFVVMLTNKKIMVIEYKGQHLEGNDDTQEKTLIGKVWAGKSGNLFSIVVKNDDGKDVCQQISNIIAS